jgi:hypothetical protein
VETRTDRITKRRATRRQELDNRMFCHHIKSEPRAKTFSDFVGLFDLFSCVITHVHISSCDMKTSPGSFETPSCFRDVYTLHQVVS